MSAQSAPSLAEVRTSCRPSSAVRYTLSGSRGHRDVQDFRNVAAHAYTEIDLEVVWDIVAKDLSPLRAAVAAELEQARHGREAGR